MKGTISHAGSSTTSTTAADTQRATTVAPIQGQPGERIRRGMMFPWTCGADAWFHPRLLELIDHAPGLEARIGTKLLVRDAVGEWHEVACE